MWPIPFLIVLPPSSISSTSVLQPVVQTARDDEGDDVSDFDFDTQHNFYGGHL